MTQSGVISHMLTRVLDHNMVDNLTQLVKFVCPVCQGHRYLDNTPYIPHNAKRSCKKCPNCDNGLVTVEVTLKRVSNPSQEAL